MRPRRPLILAVLVTVLAPVAAAVVLLFGGTAIPTCLGGPIAPCWPRDIVVPFNRTSEGIAVSLAVCGLAWLAANYVILGHLARVDRSRLVPLAVGIALFAMFMAAIGFVRGLEQRLLSAAEGGITWGLAGLALAWIVALTWAGLRSVGPTIPRSKDRP